MWRIAGVPLLVLFACGRVGFGTPPSDAVQNTVDAPGGTFCMGPSGWSVCMTTVPTRSVTLPNAIDTSLSSSCQTTDVSLSGQPAVCLIVATDIVIAGNVSVDGTEPLVLVATNTITIGAALDVSAHHGGATGPGGGASASCQAFLGVPNLDNSGGGGGAGGSFMTVGGKGGTGNGNAATAGAPPPADASAPAVLRPGCRGQNGGDGIGTGSHGTGGSGGGAVYLLAGTSITINATGSIDASGAAGSFLTSNQYFGGGGGGGSGGMIVLYAPSIGAAGARLMANGGGGSAGSSGSMIGASGSEPTSPATPAVGGALPGGVGGSGYASGATSTAGGPGPNNFGGGGGGGGAGYIRSNIALSGATVSPPATLVP